MFKIKYIYTIIFFLIYCNTCFAFNWIGYSNLNELTNKAAKEISNNYTKGVKIYFTEKNFRNAITNEIPLLSIYLYNNLQASFSKQNCSLVDTIEEADYLIAGDFQKGKKNVTIFLKCFNSGQTSKFKTFKYEIKLKHLPKDSFIETIDTKAIKIASQLFDSPKSFTNIMSGNKLKVFINPIVESRYKYNSQFSEYLLTKILNEIVKLDFIDVVDKITTRDAIRRKKGVTKTVNDALLAGANALLSGKYFISDDSVKIYISIKDIKGTTISVSESIIPKSLINLSIENPNAKKIINITKSENDSDVISISADKGSNSLIYYEGETIQLFIQVAKSLFIYIYSINSRNEVHLIYPMEGDFKRKFKPGKLYVIPSENDDWEMKIELPLGVENFKIFASNKVLPTPKFSEIHSYDLVDFYRKKALQLNAKLYENSIFFETKPFLQGF